MIFNKQNDLTSTALSKNEVYALYNEHLGDLLNLIDKNLMFKPSVTHQYV